MMPAASEKLLDSLGIPDDFEIAQLRTLGGANADRAGHGAAGTAGGVSALHRATAA